MEEGKHPLAYYRNKKEAKRKARLDELSKCIRTSNNIYLCPARECRGYVKGRTFLNRSLLDEIKDRKSGQTKELIEWNMN